MTRHELVRNKVHAVPQRSHKTNVRHRIEGAQLGKCEGAIQVLNRNAPEGAEPAVNSAHYFVHLVVKEKVSVLYGQSVCGMW